MEEWNGPEPHRTVYMVMWPGTSEHRTFLKGYTDDHDTAHREAAKIKGYVVVGTVAIDYRTPAVTA